MVAPGSMRAVGSIVAVWWIEALGSSHQPGLFFSGR